LELQLYRSLFRELYDRYFEHSPTPAAMQPKSMLQRQILSHEPLVGTEIAAAFEVDMSANFDAAALKQ